ncbi:MAG: CPBP family intramembrane glutamic endopeptidase [Alphaproteobacteria bacterium]
MPPHPDPALPYRITIRNFIGITLMTVLIFVIGGVIVVRLDPSIFTEERAVLDNLLWFSLLASVGVLASTGYVLASRTAMGWAIIGLTRPEARWVLIAVATAAALFFAGERLDALMGLGIMEGNREKYATALKTQIGLLELFAVWALVLPIPLEIYFRGVLFNFLRGMWGMELAIGLSAMTYGLLFFNPQIPVSVAYGIIHGAVFCVLFARSGSLWTAIIANGTLGALTMAKIAWA